MSWGSGTTLAARNGRRSSKCSCRHRRTRRAVLDADAKPFGVAAVATVDLRPVSAAAGVRCAAQDARSVVAAEQLWEFEPETVGTACPVGCVLELAQWRWPDEHFGLELTLSCRRHAFRETCCFKVDWFATYSVFCNSSFNSHMTVNFS